MQGGGGTGEVKGFVCLKPLIRTSFGKVRFVHPNVNPGVIMMRLAIIGENT